MRRTALVVACMVFLLLGLRAMCGQDNTTDPQGDRAHEPQPSRLEIEGRADRARVPASDRRTFPRLPSEPTVMYRVELTEDEFEAIQRLDAYRDRATMSDDAFRAFHGALLDYQLAVLAEQGREEDPTAFDTMMTRMREVLGPAEFARFAAIVQPTPRSMFMLREDAVESIEVVE